MKLTKGKLSKLFHKKKQTMRRYKNQRKYRRASKTFRQRKPLNLHRSSMKNMVVPRKIEWIGGTEPDEKVPLLVKPASDEATTEPIMAPVSEPVAEPAVALEPVTEAANASELVPESAAPMEPEPVSLPTSEPEPVPEPVSLPTSEPEPQPEPETTQDNAIPNADAVSKPIDAENVNPAPSATTPSVADALNIIADKIATAVVKKMRESPATDSYPNQDADVAVPLAVGALVEQTQLAPEK